MTAADFLCSTCHCERGSNRSGCGGCASEPSVPPPTPADLDEAAIVRDARAAERGQIVAWLRRATSLARLFATMDTAKAVLGCVADGVERGEHAGSPSPAALDAQDARQAERDAIADKLHARADRIRAVARDAIGDGVNAIHGEAQRLDHVAHLIARGTL